MPRNLKYTFPALLVMLVIYASGCDAINAIKEYFQEPEKKSVMPPAAPASIPEQAKPQPAAPQMTAQSHSSGNTMLPLPASFAGRSR